MKSTRSLNKLWSKGGLWLLFSLAGLPLITLSRSASAWMEIPPVLALSIESIAEEFGAEKTGSKSEMGLNEVFLPQLIQQNLRKRAKTAVKKMI